MLWLISVVKEQLLSIQTLEDAKSRDVLLEKAPWWSSVFAEFRALFRLETNQSRENMSMKRRARAEGRNVRQVELGSPIRSSGQSMKAAKLDTPGTLPKVVFNNPNFRTRAKVKLNQLFNLILPRPVIVYHPTRALPPQTKIPEEDQQATPPVKKNAMLLQTHFVLN